MFALIQYSILLLLLLLRLFLLLSLLFSFGRDGNERTHCHIERSVTGQTFDKIMQLSRTILVIQLLCLTVVLQG